jgi:hypothetical protein
MFGPDYVNEMKYDETICQLPREAGLVPRVFKDIIDAKLSLQQRGIVLNATLQFIEIYNENVRFECFLEKRSFILMKDIDIGNGFANGC